MRPTLSVLKVAVLSQPFKRSQLGIFQGKSKQYGNNVPFSKHKTRRTWLPNVQTKRIFSDALNQSVKLKVTTRALKTIKKHGGLDNYLTKGMKPSELGYEGMRLRVGVLDAIRTPLPASAQLRKSPAFLKEQKKTAGKARLAEIIEAQRAALNRVKLNQKPTLEDARRVRMEVMETLGLKVASDRNRDNKRAILGFLHQKANSRQKVLQGTS
ncbi:50S ribosomal protein L24 [Armillaria novae-zelandiae]|uniref:Large ribosomal subunit protein bL28c n=1 Tax=Armillaria novae-zelandiae TaxID=153914 RepID=A0AA39U755_9AGAR|nr:50S ribosomal protein L24 [Armillaria novae-zelandiae]